MDAEGRDFSTAGSPVSRRTFLKAGVFALAFPPFTHAVWTVGTRGAPRADEVFLALDSATGTWRLCGTLPEAGRLVYRAGAFRIARQWADPGTGSLRLQRKDGVITMTRRA